MTNRNKQNKLDQDMLEAIAEIIAGADDNGHNNGSLSRFYTLLTGSSPVASDTFQQQLEDRLVSNLLEKKREVYQVAIEHKSSSLFHRFLSNRPKWQIAFPVLVLIILLASLFLIPETRAALADFFGFRIEEIASLDRPVVAVAYGDQPQSEVEGDDLPGMEVGYEVQIIEIPDSRWLLHQQHQAAGFRIPQPGANIVLDGERIIPIPAVLPEGFEWQGVVIPNMAIVIRDGFASFGSTHGGGGGTNPLPVFDRSFAAYLIGGDAADRLLLLAQFDPSSLDQLAVRTFQITAFPRTPPAGGADDSAREVVATPTRVPPFYEAKTQVGYIVQHGTEEQEGLIIVAQGAREIVFNGIAGFWYDGTWASDGSWIENSDVITLTWKQGDYVYQLTGQGFLLDELTQVASSIN
jgi:hypothetical protein